MEWRPIETAPKPDHNGPTIDLWVEWHGPNGAIRRSGRITDCWWCGECHVRVEGGHGKQEGWAVSLDDYFLDRQPLIEGEHWNQYDNLLETLRVTHWMPQPEPPQT